MPQRKRLSPRKEPVQKRSQELRNAILEAATYVLKKQGLIDFTTNKVAERAGVNIASLYQYYPNKEALLFHLAEIEWQKTSSIVFAILEDQSKSHSERLLHFTETFFETEIEEKALKGAINDVGMLIENTEEYRRLLLEADTRFQNFLADAKKWKSTSELRECSDLIQSMIFGFAEDRARDEWKSYRSDARHITEMLCGHFKIP